MNSDALKTWVCRQKSAGFWQHAGLSIAAFLAGIIVLFLTFWLAYAVVWIGGNGLSALSDLILSRKLRMGHELRLGCASVFVCLLFIQYFRTDPWHWGEYPEHNNPSVSGMPAEFGLSGALAALVMNPAASANMIADILLSGPRLTVGAFKLFAQARQLRRLDESGCAQLLEVLLQNPSPLTYEDLSAAGWNPWLPQIRGLEGVRFLQKGITLSSELRAELTAALAASKS